MGPESAPIACASQPVHSLTRVAPSVWSVRKPLLLGVDSELAPLELDLLKSCALSTWLASPQSQPPTCPPRDWRWMGLWSSLDPVPTLTLSVDSAQTQHHLLSTSLNTLNTSCPTRRKSEFLDFLNLRVVLRAEGFSPPWKAKKNRTCTLIRPSGHCLLLSCGITVQDGSCLV